jgi:general secretion pathway protein D
VISEAGGAKTIAMEFYGLDIDHLLRLLSYAAQVTIVKAEGVSGVITVIAPERVPLDVAFQILDSVLQVRGWTMVKMPTGIYKVIPIADATQSGLPVHFGTKLGPVAPGDELITQVVPLKNLSANDVASQLQTLLSPSAMVMPTSTNSVIITDTSANIHRALALIENAENELAGGLKVYRLQYYDATQMADLLGSIVLSRGGGAGAVGPRPTWERRVVGRGLPQQRPGQRPQPAMPQAAAAAMGTSGPEFAYPDTRTNSLIVLATPLHLGQIEEIITQLDRPISLRDSYFVYPVQNLVASELANSIAPLIGAQVTRTGPGGEGAAGRGTAGVSGERRRTDERQQSYSRPFGTQGTGGGYRASGLGAASLDTERDRGAQGLRLEPLSGESSAARSADAFMIAQAPDVGAAVQVAPQPEVPGGGVPGEEYPPMASVTGAGVTQSVIVADDNTNTLLISAPPEQIDLIEQMIEKLDVLPPQVHIRAIIAEVELSRETSLGFQWESIGRTWGTFGGEVFTGHIGTNLGVKEPTVTVDKGVKTATLPSGFVATLSGSEFDAVINALTTDSRARVLSAPSIFTSNNQPAKIDISKQIPIPTGTFQTTTGVGAISTSIGYRSVGIVLEVTPRVTQGDFVQMEVSISADEPGAEVTVADLSYPSINQRLAEATLSVKAGHTVVLGGLMREQITHSTSRVPLLGDLPLIGPLFSSTKSGKSKSELLVFLTPYVVRNPAEMAELTDREKSRLPEIPKSLRGPSAGEPVPEGIEAVTPQVEMPPSPAPTVEMPAVPEQEPRKPEAPSAGAAEPQPPSGGAAQSPEPAAGTAPAQPPSAAPPEQPTPTPPQTQPPSAEAAPPAGGTGTPQQ